MTNVGRGALGLLDDLFDFEAFASFSTSEKRAYLILQGGTVPLGWAQEVGHDDYDAEITDTFDGIPLRPVGAITIEETLSEVETRAACEATVGTWYYNPATTLLHVRLTGDLDPGTETTVVALFAFPFGTRGSVEPILGADKGPDPGFERWNTSTVPTHYGLDGVGAPGVDVQREGTVKVAGAYALKVGIGNIVGVNDFLGDAAGGGVTLDGMPGVAGEHYIIWFHYRTDFALTTLEARLRVTADGTNYMLVDGRHTTTATDGFPLRPTRGEWKQALFAFRCPSSTADLAVSLWLFNDSGGVITDAGEAAYFDDLHVSRVQEYRYFEPRMTLEGLPELQRAANDVYFGSETAGLGSMRLLNRDDREFLDGDPFLETLLGTFDFCARSAYLRYGGTHPNGQAIPYPATEPGWAGVLRKFMVEALGGTLELESSRGVMSVQIPLFLYDRATYADLAEEDLQRPIPIVFGTLGNGRPALYGLGPGGFGLYHTIDVRYAPNAADVVDDPTAVYSYTDPEAAGRKDAARRVTLAAGTDYDLSVYQTSGTFEMLENPGPVEIVAGENDTLDFDAGAGEVSALLTPGLYTWPALVAHIDTQMQTASGQTHTVVYNSSHQIELSQSAGTFALLPQSGTNAARSAYATLGITQDEATLTGLLTYIGATAVPHEPAEQHIRINMTGYKDDSAGTFTGTANALIDLAPDVAQFLLRQVMRIPARDIDSFSFTAARTTSPQNLGVYLGGLASIQGGAGGGNTLQEILDRLEVGAYADITADALGRWYWIPRIDDVSGYAATVAVVLENADFLEFSAGRSLEDVYHIVRVNFAQDPSTGIVQSREVTNLQTPVRFDRRHTITFDSYLLDPAEVETLVIRLARPASRPMNRYEIAVKGKLMRMKLGELVDVSARVRKLAEPFDQSEPYIIRLQELTWNPLTHICRAMGYTQYFGLPPS